MTLIMLTSALLLSVGYASFLFRQKQQREKQLAVADIKLQEAAAAERQLYEEINALQHKLQTLFEDPVTNLLGWKLLEDRLNQHLTESERYQFILGMLLIDVDNFTVINETLGYDIGDHLLQAIAARLKTCIRQVDSVSRFANDTFIVLLPQLAKPETAAIVAQRILQAMAEPFQVNGQELHMTVSIGIAIYPHDGQDGQVLLRCATQALHMAQKAGKHLYQFYEKHMNQKSQRDLMLHAGLNRESMFHELQLYYQPIRHADSNAIFCMDALLHWQHPDLGMIYPQELFKCAEKQVKVNYLTEWLLRNACQQFKQWRSLGFSPTYLGIPLSIRQLENSHFIYHLSQLLQELEFNPEWILLEIQESAAQLPLEVLEKALNMLKFVGMKIAIEHFGMGSISLLSLKDLPIDYLKLDPLFIQDLHANPQATALITSLAFLAKTMSIHVIVQGVESAQQVTLLKERGCVLMQGPLLGDPLSVSEVMEKMVAVTH